MREPRSKQRFPRGGEALYELLKQDHEPVLIFARRADQTEDQRIRAHAPDILVYDHEADPMIYFWPVEKQMVVCQFDLPVDEADRARLAKALLRDGATWVTCTWLTPRQEPGLEWQNYGDPVAFMTYRGYATDEQTQRALLAAMER